MKTTLPLSILGMLFPFLVFGQLNFEYDFSQVAIGGDPEWITAANGKIFFSANDGYQGRELWTYDPALHLTYQLADFNPGPGNGNPSELTITETGLWGIASTGNRAIVWTVPNDADDVSLVVGPGADFSRIISLSFHADHVYFLASTSGAPYQLFSYGLASGELRELSSGQQAFASIADPALAVLPAAEEVYFSAVDTNDFVTKLYRYSILNDDISEVSNAFTDAGNSLLVREMTGLGDTLAFRHSVDNSTQILGFFVRGTNSIYLDPDVELPRLNVVKGQTMIAAGNRLYIRQWNNNFTRAFLSTYDFTARLATPVPGVPADRNTFYFQRLRDGDLLVCTNFSFSSPASTARKIDPATNTFTAVPQLSDLWEQLPEAPTNSSAAELRVALLAGKWFAMGPGPEGESELFRLGASSGEPAEQLTELNPGNRSGLVRLPIYPSPDGGIYLRQQLYDNQRTQSARPWLNYNPTAQFAAPLLPDVGWNFHGKLFQFPGYLVLTQLEYEGQFYEAIGFDSLSQEWITILATDNFNCNSSYRMGGSVAQLGDYLYLTKCDANGRLQLHRHQMGVPGAEAVSTFTDKSLFKGSLIDETLVSTGSQLIMSYGDSNYDWLAKGWLTFDGETFDTIPLPPGRVPREPVLKEINQTVYFNTAAAADILGSFYPMFLDDTTGQLQPILVNGDTVRQIFTDVFEQVGDLAYFFYQDSLYQHNSLTNEVAGILEWPAGFNYAYNYLPIPGGFYFIGSLSGAGRQLFSWFDGQDQPIQITSSNGSYPITDVRYALLLDDVVYFTADDGLRGTELWSYRPNCFGVSLNSEPSNVNWPTGQVSVTPGSGATPPFTYQWSNGATEASVGNLAAGFYEVTVTDASGCKISGSVWVETNGVISSSDEQETEINQILVYPNPVQDRLYIRTSGSPSIGSIHLFTAAGQKIISKQITPAAFGTDRFIDTQGLKSGTYILQLIDADGRLLSLQQIIK